MRVRLIAFVFGLQCALAGALQAGEIANGVTIEPKAYDVPINELPFYGFQAKTPQQKAADEKFITEIRATGVSLEASAAHFREIGWHFLLRERKPDIAARRFNQAWLLDPAASENVHGFAIIAQMRFNDIAYADQLFRAAGRLRAPPPGLAADHGRLLLIAKRYDDARGLLEKAVADQPDRATPKANLAQAYFHLGDKAKACSLAASVSGRDIESVRSDLATLKRQAGCP